MPYALDRFNQIANYVFTMYFVVETAIMVVGQGLPYFRLPLNVLDAGGNGGGGGVGVRG